MMVTTGSRGTFKHGLGWSNLGLGRGGGCLHVFLSDLHGV